MVFIISVVFALLIYAHFYRLTKDSLNPFGISISFYLAMYGLSTLNLSIYQNGMSIKTHLLLLIPMISIFLIGEYYCNRFRNTFRGYDELPEITMNYKIFMTIICVTSLLCVAYLVVMRGITLSLEIGVNGALNDRKGTIGEQMYGGSGIVGRFAQLFPYTLVFVMYDYIFDSFGSKTKKILELIYCALCVLYSLFVLASRGTLLLPIIAVLYLLNKKYHFKPITLGIALIGVVIAFTSYMTLRVTPGSEVFSGTGITNKTFNSIYNYFALSFNNFDMLVRNGSPMTGIQYSLISLSKILGIYNPSNLLQYKTDFFNSRVFIYGFYHDLGLFGVVLWPIIIYVLIGWLYASTRKKHPEMILLLGMYGKAIFVMSFGNYFFQSFSDEFQYYICIILLVLGYKTRMIVARKVVFKLGKTQKLRIRGIR